MDKFMASQGLLGLLDKIIERKVNPLIAHPQANIGDKPINNIKEEKTK